MNIDLSEPTSPTSYGVGDWNRTELIKTISRSTRLIVYNNKTICFDRDVSSVSLVRSNSDQKHISLYRARFPVEGYNSASERVRHLMRSFSSPYNDEYDKWAAHQESGDADGKPFAKWWRWQDIECGVKIRLYDPVNHLWEVSWEFILLVAPVRPVPQIDRAQKCPSGC